MRSNRSATSRMRGSWVTINTAQDPIPRQSPQQFHHLATGGPIKGGRRLVRQQEPWMGGKGAGDGFLLLLTTGQVVGQFPHLILQADGAQPVPGLIIERDSRVPGRRSAPSERSVQR